MRVLNVNKYYYLRGGAERYFFQLGRLLESRGHEVIPLAMRGERNVPTPYERYFVSEVEFRGHPGAWQELRAAGRVLYSWEARAKAEALIRETRPDVAHLHNIAHQLSPSILGPMKRHGMRVVQTLHDYKLVCPTYRLYAKGEVCEACGDGHYFAAVRRRCNGGSWTASLVSALETTLHRTVLRSYRHVDRFLAPSRFLRDKVVALGIPGERVMHVPYYLDLGEFPVMEGVGSRFVYLGRLSDEKGLPTLLRAMERVRGMGCLVAGEGPMEDWVRREAGRLPPDRVRLTGYVDGDRLRQVLAEARAVVVPSEWYENSPLTIYEAFACGRPVVGSRIGGIPELVLHERTGLLFEPGDAEGLAENLQRLADDPGLARRMGREARSHVEALTDRERHLAALREAYGSACV